ncbi:hypothetical protein NX722_27840 [Endozoicomonas gorgoniicola]|uniref:Uncharacterized protein n=1 Tax=Endozoicomonas gorgoniicola TaxID=1234144 RepID=A0ABT3N4W9_9GAMM|nr:hypothetical protein [Endozoicomonas gorgoniicola]MCW7556378.1 hypothetical protein [Endozoicomonas gorgoniicola]
MPTDIPTLADLIQESQTTEDQSPDDVLFQFVSSYYPPYDIDGCEEEAISLLINFSVKRDAVDDPLSSEEAVRHLADNNNQLIKRFQATLKGWHTHNRKFPLSFQRGNIRCLLPYDENDPYVHSGSVKLRKRYGYSQNAAYIKASKGMLAEFIHHGRLTSMLEEIQQNNTLGEQFMAMLYEAEEAARRLSKDQDENDESAVDNLYERILSLSSEEFPDTATDPQIFALTDAGEPEFLLSPSVHTGMMAEINLRLKESAFWLSRWMRTGTGNDVHTYGDLLSDCGGRLRVLRSEPPVERKGEFGRLMNRFVSAGNLYSFKIVTAFFMKFATAYIDEETGEQKRWTTFRQNHVLENEADKIAKSIFSQYRKLDFYLSLGKKLPKRCQHIIDKSKAQGYLAKRQTRTTKNIDAVLDELMPGLFQHIDSLISEDVLPFTEHQQKIVQNAIIGYLRTH